MWDPHQPVAAGSTTGQQWDGRTPNVVQQWDQGTPVVGTQCCATMGPKSHRSKNDPRSLLADTVA
jgi:hypothetical protein